LSALGVLLICAVVASGAEPKSIRLRTENIAPSQPDRARTAQPAAEARTVSGLFLIQFEDRAQPGWRETLRPLGVELLRYVPDDAFIARFENVQVNVVKALPFVRWVGDFRPDHKIDPRFQGRLRAGPANEPAEVSVLLSTRATPAEIAEAARSLPGASRAAVPRLGTILRGRTSLGQVRSLAQSPGVLWIEPAPRMKLFDEVGSKITAGDGGGHVLFPQSFGFDGSGVTVAVADSGLDSGDPGAMHPDLAGRVRALFFYGTLSDAADEHSHGTHVAGIVAGNATLREADEEGHFYGLGVAPGAQLIAQRLFDGAGNYEPPPSFETLTRDAVRAGADIGSNSWGDDTQGRYDLSAAEFDGLARDADGLALEDQPYFLEFSAGNAGPGAQTIGSPAVAKNVIATGASQNNRFNLPVEEFSIYADGQEAMADFSSRGPCEDGRIKPDVVAPGTWIASLRSIFANDDYAWWPISENYMYQGGTSQAGPHVSGAAAVLVQYLREALGFARPSPALLKAALIHSAVDMDDAVETGPAPNMDEGWGRVDLTQIILSSRQHEFVDQTVLLSTGQTYERAVLVGSGDEPLKITLVYTDVPGFPGAIPALVNDLDLEVLGPDGTLYRGNQFEEGESQPNPGAADSINNVEGVHLFAPLPGEYIVRVRARNVPQDARSDTGAVDQDFALVVSGAIAPPGTGIVTFDRSAYSAPALIKLVLVDQNLAGQPTATLLLRSATESAGETIMLRASGVTGLFTANVATATGPALANGRLEVSHGDAIEAIYQDANPPGPRTFRARADLLPPVISGVNAVDRFGRIIISWHTDEEANAVVRYGTNTLDLAATNRFFETSHEVPLGEVMPSHTYRYVVISEDLAGNRTTNANPSFTFTPAQAPTVLLVDAYYNDLFEAPPLSGYTAVLERLGVSYATWDASVDGTPPAEVLRPYRCVIWRVPEFSLGVTWSAADTQAVTNYLAGGGSLLMSSMEFLSRLEEPSSYFPSFARDVLQVQSFEPDTGVSRISGAGSEPIGSGIDLTLDYTPYEDFIKELVGIPADASDTILPTTNAAPILLDGGSVVGVRSPKTGQDQPGRVVFLSFPLDAVPLGAGVGNNRAGLLRNILNFLVPSEGNSTIGLDNDVYAVPSRVVVEVEDSDLAGQAQTTVHFYGPQQSEGVAVTLTPTARRGLFRGALTLVSSNSPGGGPQLLVQSGDTIRADYLDASASQTLSATATVETTPPAISSVLVEPGYVDALVYWQTSEPADALVQFSDAPGTFPVNFTAYDPNFDLAHALTLEGLVPDRTYYFRVVSRDRAGNTTIDDNNGQLYTFTTLQPLSPPWQDDLEHGSSAWALYTADESEIEWTLGVPGNGAAAYSPANAWGSNLDGRPASLAESFLISPAIALTGGNRATLRFWQNYDFSSRSELDLFEYGELLLITNAATAPVTLDEVVDVSGDWEGVEYDLTPYLGNVVYVVWHYVLISFDSLERFGWLVDDVSVTVTNVEPGTIQIANNLAQAAFVLSGPVSHAGRGWSLTLTNAPPGEYRVLYGDVAYYATPPAQTNTLLSGGTVVFTGNYTFADANGNGMSDAWEQAFFHEVSPERTPTTDSDGDGATDLAEFNAGTDPTSAQSALRLLTPVLPGDGTLLLRWPALPGRAYRMEHSPDAVHWAARSDWMQFASTPGTFSMPLPGPGAPFLFRLQVRP
jgi:hypothetical protein